MAGSMAERIVVAMSGGVDSSVAAARLHAEGQDVSGVTLQLWGKDVCTTAGTRLCCSVRDAVDAKSVCRRLGIPHTTLDLADTFRQRVIGYFVDSYHEGLTPNPCIACNDHIKFGDLLTHARQRGAATVATGHYARVESDPATGRRVLRRGISREKDQSYVLFNLTQEQLAGVRFPVGGLSKAEVREAARELGLVTADKPDSQDVCFVRDGNKNGFLRRELGGDEPAGPIVDTEGRQLGQHQGLLGYTIGQREGLGLAVGRPLYIVAIDRPNNRLVVGNRTALLRSELAAERVNWVSIAPPERPLRADVQIRSRHSAAPAQVQPLADGRVRVVFDEPQSAVTPGQAAVFYDDDVVLGGGWIAKDE